jgi:hypothetical protein
LTSYQSVLSALAIILVDLLGRAGLDKMLALQGGPAIVALWAQLQSVIELVGGVAIAGVLQGMTVLIAQANDERDERSLLHDALKLGLVTSLAMALIVAVTAPDLSIWLTQRKIETGLFWLAALTGCIAVLPATLNAYWLGKHRQPRMLALSLQTSSIWLLVAASAWSGYALRGLMWVQSVSMAIIGIAIWQYLNKMFAFELPQRNGQEIRAEYFRKLVQFVPVGLMIGILSPLSMLLIRGMLSSSLSWSDVGFLQALWRSTEWVTATAAGVLSLIFLPRFSATYPTIHGRPRPFQKEMLRAAVLVLIPTACLLLLIYFNQRDVLALLYDTHFVVSNETAAWILLGSWIRIASWVFLFGLFAARSTQLIMAGEVLSLPLYVLLLWQFAEGMTLERTALLYLVSYLIYLVFNAVALLYVSRN